MGWLALLSVQFLEIRIQLSFDAQISRQKRYLDES